MIRIIRDGTTVHIGIKLADVAPTLTAEEVEKAPWLWFTREMGGQVVAAATLTQAMRSSLSEHIRRLRMEAYAQGAKDRAYKATSFSGDMTLGLYRGGCC